MRTLRRGSDLGSIARDWDDAQSESGTPIYVDAYRVVHESNTAHNILTVAILSWRHSASRFAASLFSKSPKTI